MEQKDFGRYIAELRKKRGYTQLQLAEALSITDKAVSKWERGLCLPDSTMLPLLACVLDTDLGSLIPDVRIKEPWQGLLFVRKSETDLLTLVNGRSLLHYLLSYFLLLGIKDVSIVYESPELEASDINKESLASFGINLLDTPCLNRKTFVVYGKTLLLGSYLTYQLTSMMLNDEDIVPMIDDMEVPFLFTHRWDDALDEHLRQAKHRSLYRGMICLPLENREQVKDASELIRIYEKYHQINFCDLHEIARNRGLID